MQNTTYRLGEQYSEHYIEGMGLKHQANDDGYKVFSYEPPGKDRRQESYLLWFRPMTSIERDGMKLERILGAHDSCFRDSVEVKVAAWMASRPLK